jgi:LacI family transcriptional regulator
MGQVRIKEVAEAAGVSTSSVSRYLNGRIILPPQTASRIDEAVSRLGYYPNAIARRLNRGASETLGFITTDIAYPFFAAVASAAEAEASCLGYSMAIFNSRNDMARELSFLSRIDDRQVDGILFMANHVDDGALARKIEQTRRVVLLDEDVAGTRAPKVFAANELGGLLATRHLIDRGHVRIAYVAGPRGMISSDERYRGYLAALAGAGLAHDPALVFFGCYEEEFGITAFNRLWSIDDRPTAVFATADMLAIGIIRAARDGGVEIPGDLSVVGFDDMLHVNLLTPALTTVRHSATEFGRHGVRLLVGEINGTVVPESPVRIPVELIVRDSVAAPRPRRMPSSRRAAEAGTSRTLHRKVKATAG